jgi:hypothetical protein
MRSYDTGKYALLKDGNFQLTMSRILASNFDHITVVLPNDVSDFSEFTEELWDRFGRMDIEFKFLQYGANAVETRKEFWKLNRDFFFNEEILEFDLLITDITGYSGTMSFDIPFINNFNVTKLPELDRPYIDEFFEVDVANMRKALFTTVINPRQRDYIIECVPDLKDKVIAYTKVAHDEMMPTDHKTKLLFENHKIFWPFRISDKAYQFNEFLEMFIKNELYKNHELIITDPNDSYKGSHDFVTVYKPTKEMYYKILQTRPIVIMLDDIDTVLHPGTIEFARYGCNLITYENKLLNNEYQIKTIDDIPGILSKLGYNTRTNLFAFVYMHHELSTIYCKEFVNKCLQNL